MEQQNTQIEQPKQNSSSIFIISILSLVIVLLLGFIGYVYSAKDIVKKDHIKEQYIKKNDVTFDSLPLYIQDKYVLKSLYDHKINELETKRMRTLKKIEEAVVKKESDVLGKIIEAEEVTHTRMDTNIGLIPKEQNIDSKRVSQTLINNKKTQTYTCKTLKSSSEYITKECRKTLEKFLDENKDAKRFEVIGLIDNQEFVLIDNLEDVYGKKRVGNLSKYAQHGLSKQRVIEASWAIRQHLGKQAQVDSVNYTITKRNKRGFVVKAYR
jgi:hypothetical protein